MSERAERFRAVNRQLRDAGYFVFGRPMSRPDQIYARFVVAVNTIAEMMGKHPYGVYKAILVRVERIAHGSPHEKGQSGYVRAGEHQDAEALHVFCPCCGADLLSSGPPTPADIIHEIKARSNSPLMSPQSIESERRKSPEEGNAEEVER